MLTHVRIIRGVVVVLLIAALVYLGIGLGFHVRWRRARAACRDAQVARGEFVELETFGPMISLFFDVTHWPIYAWANVHHFGTPFATPCTHE